jgi:hypothetical protein
MFEVAQITEHMEVVGSDGAHVGTVDHVRAKLVILTRADPAAEGQRRYIPLATVRGIDDNILHLSVPAEEALARGREMGPRPELDP